MTSGNASSGGLGAETAAPSDADLLRAHVDGDPQAFAELVRRHRDRLWAVALRTIGDREEAADAVQDALLAAHRNAARFRGESAVTTWLHRIVVNACLDRIRRRQSHPTVPLPDGNRESDRPTGVEPAAPVQDHDTALLVREALAALPPDQRAAIVLVDVQGYPVAEAAEILGVAEGTIKSRCARGRARMAIALGHLRVSPSADPKADGRPTGPKTSAPPAGPKAGGPAGSEAGSEHRRPGGNEHRRPEGGSAPAGPTTSSSLGRPGTDSAPSGSDGGSVPGRPAAGGDSGQSAGSRPAAGGDSGQSAGSRPAAGGDSGQSAGSGASARARDTGHEADGNRGGAGSVPSGPAAASGTRPSAHDRRDQR